MTHERPRPCGTRTGQATHADERIELAGELLASVDEDEEAGTPEEIEAAWDDEIRRRDEQVLAGGGGAHDAEGVLAEAERIIRTKR